MIADRLEKLMKEKGLNQVELSKKSGLTQGQIGHILSGRRQNLRQSTLEKLSKGLGVPASILLGDHGVIDKSGIKKLLSEQLRLIAEIQSNVSKILDLIDNPKDEIDANLPELFKKPVADLEFSVRVQNRLRMMNVQTLGDLVRKTPEEILSARNFGYKSLNEIKFILNDLGLSLGMSSEEIVRVIRDNF